MKIDNNRAQDARAAEETRNRRTLAREQAFEAASCLVGKLVGVGVAQRIKAAL